MAYHYNTQENMMIYRFFLILSLALLLSGFPAPLVVAGDFKLSRGLINPAGSEILNAAGLIDFQIKRDQPYDESKDPALRRGTENWEQDQGSFFAIPALIVGIIGLVMYFSRDKN